MKDEILRGAFEEKSLCTYKILTMESWKHDDKAINKFSHFLLRRGLWKQHTVTSSWVIRLALRWRFQTLEVA